MQTEPKETHEKLRFDDPAKLTAFLYKSMEIACKRDLRTEKTNGSEGYASPFRILAEIYECIEIVDPPGYVPPPKPDTYGFTEAELNHMKRMQCAYGNNHRVILNELEYYDLKERIPNFGEYIDRLDRAIAAKKITLDLCGHYAAIRECYEKESARTAE